MKHLRFLFLAAFCALLMCSCATVYEPSLIVAPAEKGDKVQGAGNVAALTDDSLQMVAAPSYFDGKNADFLVSFASIDDSTYYIDEHDVSLYGGNFQTGKWELIGSWDSLSYMRASRSRATTGIILAGVIGTIAVLDAIMNPDSDTDLYIDYGYSYHRYPHYHGYYGFSFHSDDPGVTATFLALDTIETTIVLSQLASMEQAELAETLLASGNATRNISNSGLVRFNRLPKYPDYKLVYDSGNQNMEFMFSRSDREEIINPWKEKSGAIYTLNYNYTIATRRNNVSFAYLAPQYAGFFCGVSFFPPFDFEKQLGKIGASFGVNWKILPFFWLQGGMEVQQMQGSDEKYDILGLMGIEYCIYHNSLYAGLVYSSEEKSWYGEVGIGFAFF